MAGVIFDGKTVAPAIVVEKEVPSTEWQPDPEWPDIEKIVEEDTSDYSVKIGVLYVALSNSIQFTEFGDKTAAVARFSDGQTISYPAYNSTITLDPTKYFELSNGLHVYWAVYCFSGINTTSSTAQLLGFATNPALYVYIKGDVMMGSGYSRLDSQSAFNRQYALRYVKVNGSLVLGNNENSFINCASLEKIPKNLSFVSSYTGSNAKFPYQGCSSLKEIYFEDVFQNLPSTDPGWTGVTVLPKALIRTKPKSIGYWFNTNKYPSLCAIPDGWDFSECTDFSRCFYGVAHLTIAGTVNMSANTTSFTSSTRAPFAYCTALREIKCTLPSNTNMWFDSSTVISIESFRFMADHAPDVTATPRKLTIGSTNISRCNEADPTIITDLNARGWTVA